MLDYQNETRQARLYHWLKTVIDVPDFTLKALTGDASFRRYYRLYAPGFTRIIMDAPPDKEPLEPFLKVGQLLTAQGICAPQVHALEPKLGFLVLEDFGDALLLSEVNNGKMSNGLSDEALPQEMLYQTAINTLIQMQACESLGLPRFDTPFMLQELNIFTEWFLKGYLKLELSPAEKDMLHSSFQTLCHSIDNQPKAFVHRDYHSRNIMLINDGAHPSPSLGIIDFQDAMHGPQAYDLVSLLKDCYVQWPRETVLRGLNFYYDNSRAAHHGSIQEFIQAFELCGIQRHLKVLGVFSRLFLRDNKPNYLKDLPLTLHYVLSSLEASEDLLPLYAFMQDRVVLP